MADNITLNSGSGGSVLATDEVGTDHYQRVKLADGTADSSTVIAAGGGAEANALRVTIASDSTGVVSVDDGGGSITIDGTVGGNAADSAAVSGAPVLNGGYAVATDGTDPTSVSEGDAASLRATLDRLLIVSQTHPRWFNASADYATAQTNATVQAAPGAGLRLYITDLTISNGATAGNITLLDGSGGSVLYEIYPAVNGGVALTFRTPIVCTANTPLAITSTTVTTHSVNVQGYVAP